MAGFGSLAPGMTDDPMAPEAYQSWQDREAAAGLAAIQAEQARHEASGRSWYDTINDVAHAPRRIFGALASAPASPEADQQAMMPETFQNPLVKNLAGSLGEAVKSGVTAPGRAASGDLPMWGEDGHTSPQAIKDAFDTASIAGGGSVAGTAAREIRNPGTDLRILGQKIGGKEDAFSIHPPSEVAAPYHALVDGGMALASDSEPGAAISALDRATEQGFDTGKVWYHSALQPMEAFDKNGKFIGRSGTAGIHLTDSPEMASRYLDRFGDYDYKGEPFAKNIMPVYVKPGKTLEMGPEERLSNAPMGSPVGPGYKSPAEQMGYDALIRPDVINRRGEVKHVGPDFRGAVKGNEMVLTDPSRVRSIHAEFAPENAGKSGLLLSDSAKPGIAIDAAGHAPTFNTAAEPALARTTRKVGTPEQWRNELSRYGVTKEEMATRGLDDLKPGQPMQREAIEQHLAANPVEIKPVDKGTPKWADLPGDMQHDLMDRWDVSNGHEAQDMYDRLAAQGDLSGYELPGMSPTKFGQYQLPGGENYRERLLTLPLDQRRLEALSQRIYKKPYDQLTPQERPGVDRLGGGDQAYKGPHWTAPEEANTVVHRRSTDRTMDAPPTAEEQAALDAHAAAAPKLEDLRQRQGGATSEIRAAVKPIYEAWDDQIRADLKAKKITMAEAKRRGETGPDTSAIAPLQDKLQALRAQEDAINKGLPPKPEPRQIKTLHDEEVQSDWHQTGAKNGYGVADPSKFKAEKTPTGVRVTDGAGGFIADYAGKTPEEAISHAQKYFPEGVARVPDAPFKDSWSKLALHDQIREAAEKGHDRISWTGGKAQPTNPKNLGYGTPEEQAKIEKGLVDFYDRRKVDEANKIGKQHGVQVQKGDIPTSVRMTDRNGKPIHNQESVHYMDIPQSLKDQALKKGFSMFEDSGKAGGIIAAAEHAGIGHNSGGHGGLTFPEEEAANRLRMKVQREQKAADKGAELPGAPSNERTVIPAPKGSGLPDYVAGKLTPEDWVKRHEHMLTPEEVHGSAKWYDEIYGEFLRHTKGDEDLAKKYMRSWLVAQQNADVSSSMSNMLLQREQVQRGVPEADMKAGGMPNPTVAARRVMQDQPITEGVGQKIADFVDAAEGKSVRSWMGNKPEGGKPFVVDVHTARDTGMVDQELKNHLTRLGYDKKAVEKLKTDLGTSPTATQYENRAKFGHELTDYLNARKWQGRDDWTPKEVQAIGWMGMTKLTANKADNISTGLERNMRHLSMELAPGEGSPWDAKYGKRFAALPPDKQREMTHAMAQDAIKRASKIAGIDVRDIVHGTGGWQNFQNPSTVAQSFSSKQGADIAANALGHLLQQTEVWSNKVKPVTSNPKGFAVDLIANGKHNLGTDEGLRDFWGKIMAADPTSGSKSPLFQGYQPIKMPDGRAGIRVLIDRGGEGTKNAIDSAISGPIKSVVDQLPHDMEVRRHEAEIYKARNDWKEHPNGQAYRQRVVDLAGPDRAAQLDRHGAELEAAFRKHLETAEAGGAKRAAVKKPAAAKPVEGFGSLAPGAP